ncbi:hypothetical protein AUEXF2481DRAFT_43949 [Aureobasidium subglaciale EXF-2481]|uniref:Uncharacterized protein n=1 Tax=Aureobasidium subglaciale (strain EXF-2481) TaxID=1043005 RepID=A0A074Y6J7_AURSE|nr:uncharacterized protein AUEXF2481DRAFT_43949 [Aureobasidium subglaciale EXF-2481]KEQ91574.1 hypothetical protein AUEXF2481DRAFT_43949 [Aureobasidium subglaciale EXF-2481]
MLVPILPFAGDLALLFELALLLNDEGCTATLLALAMLSVRTVWALATASTGSRVLAPILPFAGDLALLFELQERLSTRRS